MNNQTLSRLRPLALALSGAATATTLETHSYTYNALNQRVTDTDAYTWHAWGNSRLWNNA